MRANVMPGNVGNKIPVTVTFSVKNQAAFLLLVAWSKALASKKKPQFKGHIEARKTSGRIQFHRGKIVDS